MPDLTFMRLSRFTPPRPRRSTIATTPATTTAVPPPINSHFRDNNPPPDSELPLPSASSGGTSFSRLRELSLPASEIGVLHFGQLRLFGIGAAPSGRRRRAAHPGHVTEVDMMTISLYHRALRCRHSLLLGLANRVALVV